MARSPQSTTVRIGGIMECGFVFRTKAGDLISQTEVNFEVFVGGVSSETFNQTDTRVTLNATLGADLAAELDITDAENAAGTGLVSVELTPDSIARWAVYADGVTPIGDAETVFFWVLDKAEQA